MGRITSCTALTTSEYVIGPSEGEDGLGEDPGCGKCSASVERVPSVACESISGLGGTVISTEDNVDEVALRLEGQKVSEIPGYRRLKVTEGVSRWSFPGRNHWTDWLSL